MKINEKSEASSLGFTIKRVPSLFAVKVKQGLQIAKKAGVIAAVLAIAFANNAPADLAFANHDPFGGVEMKKVDICHIEGNGRLNLSPQVNVNAITPTGHHQHVGDIIPPFHHKDGSYGGSPNWNAETQAIYNNGCIIPTPPQTGSLLVTKNTVNNNGTFSFTRTGDATPFEIITTGNTGTKLISGLTPGTYTVTEDEGALPANWSKTGDTCTNVSVVANQQASCTITNTYNEPSADTGLLTLIKKVIGGVGDAGADLWDLIAKDSTDAKVLNGTSGVNGELAVGDYTLSEANGPAGYDASDWECQDGKDDPFTLVDGALTLNLDDNLVCTITNTIQDDPDPTGTLTLVKVVEGGDAFNTDWTLSADGPTSVSGETGSKAVTDVEVNIGDYELSESGPDGYIASDWFCSTSDGRDFIADNNTITVHENESITCTITNTFDDGGGSGGLSIAGYVYNDNNPENGEFDEEEDGLEGWTINLFRYSGIDVQTIVGPGETLVDSDQSDVNGLYQFTDLDEGCYIVREEVENNWDQTEPDTTNHEYQIALGNVECDFIGNEEGPADEEEMEFIDEEEGPLAFISSLFRVKAAQAQAAPSYNFGNVFTGSTGGGGGSGPSGNRLPDGQVLGDFTGLPYQAPEQGQVLGATDELPRTGLPVGWMLWVFAGLAIVYLPKFATVKNETN